MENKSYIDVTEALHESAKTSEICTDLKKSFHLQGCHKCKSGSKVQSGAQPNIAGNISRQQGSLAFPWSRSNPFGTEVFQNWCLENPSNLLLRYLSIGTETCNALEYLYLNRQCRRLWRMGASILFTMRPTVQPSHEMERHEITLLDSAGESVLSRSIASFDEELETESMAKPKESQPVAQ